MSRAQAAQSGPPLSGSRAQPQAAALPVGSGEQEKQALPASSGGCPRCLPVGPSLQGTTPRPEPPSSPALAHGVREAARTLVHAPLSGAPLGRTPSLWGLTAGAVLLRSATVGSAKAGPRPPEPKGGGPAPSATALPPACAGAGLPQPVCSRVLCGLEPSSPFPSWARAGGVPASSLLLPSPIQVLGSAKQVQDTEWPQKALQPPPPQGQHCHHGAMPPDTAHQACGRTSPATAAPSAATPLL